MKKQILSLLSAMLLASVVSAQAPNSINYQAAVRNSSGAVLASALVQVRFTIHDATASGPTLFQETNTVTTTAQGLLNTTLGSGTAVTGPMAGIDWTTGVKFLEVELNTGAGYISIGSQQMVSVPYALYAAKSGNTSPWTLSGTDIFNNNTGKVGIGTTIPSPMFHTHINGLGTISSGLPYQGTVIVTGAGSATSASGVYAEGGWRGVFGRNKGASSGIEAIGVYGLLDSGTSYTSGMGVKGDASASGPTNYGVYGTASNGTGINYGVYGKTSSKGAGIYGVNNGPGTTFISVFSTLTPAIVGQQRSVSGGRQTGLLAHSVSSGSNHSALVVLADSSTSSNFGAEIYAKGGSTSTTYGVYASASGGSTNYAGYFTGTTYSVYSASGTKSFKIDHPLDPENKYLVHSSVESNDMMNLYNGNVTTDVSGVAKVMLPSYFIALNKDFKYQLTCIGTFAQAIIAEEISGNSFTIKTDKPNVKVSWLVAGVRHDQTALKYPIINEIEKPANEKGFFLVPEAFGFGQERNAAWHNSSQNKDAVYPSKPEELPAAPNSNEK
ncbi:MAG: hypothetical protein IT256_03485 [Chitinophagaceae bacterium]|nr:hypothetical protein [Chitinophagaceae bacterium]